jgi:hypothetical protein
VHVRFQEKRQETDERIAMRLRKMFLWYALFLVLPAAMLLLVLGKNAVLNESARVKPYAVVFRDSPEMFSERPQSDRLVIFFGDSSVAQPPWAAKDNPHIPALLEAELAAAHPELGKVSVVEWAFEGARLFHYFCLLFEAARYEPELVVIPINWRNLGPDAWEHEEKYAFRELSAVIPLSQRSLPVAQEFLSAEDISPAAQMLYSVRRPLLYLSGLRALGRSLLGFRTKRDELARLLSALPPIDQLMAQYTDARLFEQYPLEIGDTNGQLQALRALAESCPGGRTKVLFYITPIHLEEMRRREPFDGAAFSRSVRIVAAAAQTGCSACIDLSGLLGENGFIDCFEHYTPAGNQKVARALAPEAARLIKAGPAAPPVATAQAGFHGGIPVPAPDSAK